MPYIVITTTLDQNEYRTETQLAMGVATRVAVATLDEARETVWELVKNTSGPNTATVDQCKQVDKLPECGGTVGPLPDGTIIEVKKIDWVDIAVEGWQDAVLSHEAKETNK